MNELYINSILKTFEADADGKSKSLPTKELLRRERGSRIRG